MRLPPAPEGIPAILTRAPAAPAAFIFEGKAIICMPASLALPAGVAKAYSWVCSTVS